MAKNLSVFLPYILPEVPGCPGPLAEQRALTACIEFCERTNYWRREQEPMFMVKNISEYDVAVPNDAHLVTIIDPIEFNGKKVYSRTKEWLDMNENDWDTKQGDAVRHYYNKSLGVFRPVPYPDTTIASSIKFDIALKPLPTATSVEDFLFNEFFRTIANGALAELHAVPGKKWSNPELAAYRSGLFEDGISKAATKAKSGFKTHERYRKSKAHFF